MKIAVIGASGRTGSEFTRVALAAGHEVVAVVRDATRISIPPTRVATADARSAEELTAALHGIDAVVFTVGPGPTAAHGIMTESIAATVHAMHNAGVERLVVVSASGPFAEGDNPLLGRVIKPIVQRILSKPFADIASTDAFVQASDTAWTIVRPPQLTDKPGHGGYKRNPRFGMQITRADLATALLDALEASQVGKVITVAN